MKSKKGFTLIELMIVVAIIGILAAIAIPNFRAYQLKAKRGELPTNLKAIKTSQVAFQAEEDYFKVCAVTPATGTGAVKQDWTAGGIADFNSIGWQPSGNVYGVYSNAAGNSTDGIDTSVIGTAISDIDGDNADANYDFEVDVEDPGNDRDVTRVTGSDVF